MTRRIPKKTPRLDPEKLARRQVLAVDRNLARQMDEAAAVLGKANRPVARVLDKRQDNGQA